MSGADPTGEGIGSDAVEAVRSLGFEELIEALHPKFAAAAAAQPSADGDAGRPEAFELLTVGTGASPGAAAGVMALSADDALEMSADGTPVILVASETTPADVAGMGVSSGILTARGGLASHAAVVARGWGIPAVCGASELRIASDHVAVGARRIEPGTPISLDGATGEVWLGSAAVTDAEMPTRISEALAALDAVLAGRFAVRANADSVADALLARQWGASGIGLCRTEHMCLAPELIDAVRSVIVSDASSARAQDGLQALSAAQRQDFEALLAAMDGLPVIVRLLDAPLHELLAGADREQAATWHEHNPMLGLRGVRLGAVRPRLYAAQVRALCEATLCRQAAGGRPEVSIMVPLVSAAAELAAAVAAVKAAWARTASAAGADPEALRPRVGVMIETPRAALLSGALAAHAEFLSFGTNDLTQLAFGFSRDDLETRLLPLYLDEGLLSANPFAALDSDGVGELIEIAVDRARAARDGIETGMCGEHGGDPASVAFAVDAGLDYVSCSPLRVPVARLAAAKTLLDRASSRA